MKGFIEIHNLENDPYILNVSQIESVMVNKNGTTIIYPVGSSDICYYKVIESYDEAKQKIEEATR